MPRVTGRYRIATVGGETIRAFVPAPLPPRRPPLRMEGELGALHSEAIAALGRLAVAAAVVPSTEWFLYGFVRKEALISSQIEGTQATLEDVLTYEVTRRTPLPADVRDVSNYVDALSYARREMGRSAGLPLSTRLLCEAHRRLMHGTRGAEKSPGCIRTSQNWIGGTRPGNAGFVPAPPEEVPEALGALERWLHAKDALPPLVRAGLAHAQFETIHPFLDGNGRIGRLLITLLVKHWGLLESPVFYLSLAFKRRREEYYRRLTAIRTEGDWEGWTAFFLECAREAADDGVSAAERLSALLGKDRRRLLAHAAATMPAVRLFDALPEHPIVTFRSVIAALSTTKPTAAKAIDVLRTTGILEELTGRRRDRVYAYRRYLNVLAEGAEPPPAR